MIQDWISGKSSGGTSKNSTPILDVEDVLIKASYASGKEIGIIHPSNSSIVKIKNNGMIDIFTATNQGIRIDPVNHVINFLADHEQHHINDMTVWASKFINLNAKRDITMKTESSIIMNTKVDWTVNTDRHVVINAKENLSLNAKNIKITSLGNMRLEAKHIAFNAGRYDYE